MRRKNKRRWAALLTALCLAVCLPATAMATEEPIPIPIAPAPVIVTDLPMSMSVPLDGSFTLLLQVQGEGITYQWYKDDVPLEGQTGPSLSVSAASTAHAGRYFCYILNPAGALRSNDCVVSVLGGPVLTQDITITSLTLNAGDTISLSAAASGANLAAQWYYRKGTEFGEISGQNTGTLSVTATEAYDGTEIYCQFYNDMGGVVTSTCRVTVNPAPSPTPVPDPPKVTKPPYGEVVEERGSTLFIAHADNATSCIWRFVNPSAGGYYEYDKVGSMFPGLIISGGATDTLSLSNIPYDLNGWRVACLFIGPGGETLSEAAGIEVRRLQATLSIVTQPVGGSMALDEKTDFILSVQASAGDSGGTISYQWESADVNSSAAMRPVSGATSAAYTPVRKEGTTYYRVGVSLTANGTTSQPYYSNTVPVTFTAKKAHEHVYSSAWEHNDLSHWHQCTCGDHGSEALHSYEWTILQYPTGQEDGQQKGVCTVCGYETVQPIPAGSMATPTPEPEIQPQRKNSRTFLYVLLGALALAAVAVAGYLVFRVLRSGDDEEPDEFEETPVKGGESGEFTEKPVIRRKPKRKRRRR